MSLLMNTLVSLIFVLSLQLGDSTVLNSREKNLLHGGPDEINDQRSSGNNIYAPASISYSPGCSCGSNEFCKGNSEDGYGCFCDPGYGVLASQFVRNLLTCEECNCGQVFQGDGKGRKFGCEFHSEGYSSTKVCTCNVAGYRETNGECRADEVCKFAPCLNDAKCISVSDGDGFQCECPNGFQGKRCEHEMNSCDLHPCRNGGTCKIINLTAYECQCPPIFTGENCSVEVNPCDKQPCKNGATCRKINAKVYECKCRPTFTGENCTVEEEITTATSIAVTSTEEFKTSEATSEPHSTKSPMSLFNFRKMKVEKFEIQEGVYKDEPKYGLFNYFKLKIKNISIFNFDFQDINESKKSQTLIKN